MLRLICIAAVTLLSMPDAGACKAVYRPNMAYLRDAETMVPAGARELFKAAQAAEGRSIGDALQLYARATNAGDGRAAKRLGEIYDKGVEGVPRDYAAMLKWYAEAIRLGAVHAPC